MERVQVAAVVVPSQLGGGQKHPSGAAHPLDPIAGKSIPGWIVDAALGASVRRIGLIVEDIDRATRSELIGRADDALIEFVHPTADVADTLSYAVERLGSELTLRDSSHILLLPADCPQLQAGDIRKLLEQHVNSGAAATVVVGEEVSSMIEPVVIRDESGQITKISDVPIGGSSVACIRASLLVPALRRVVNRRWDRGVPLAEIAGVLADTGHDVVTTEFDSPLIAIRSMSSRAHVELMMRDRIIDRWLTHGVSIPDRRQVAIDATVTLGQGVQILTGTVLEGSTVVGDGARIGPNTQLIDATIGCSAEVPHAIVDGGEIPAHFRVAPFSVHRSSER